MVAMPPTARVAPTGRLSREARTAGSVPGASVRTCQDPQRQQLPLGERATLGLFMYPPRRLSLACLSTNAASVPIRRLHQPRYWALAREYGLDRGPWRRARRGLFPGLPLLGIHAPVAALCRPPCGYECAVGIHGLKSLGRCHALATMCRYLPAPAGASSTRHSYAQFARPL
jgi:hypothetical protein